MFKFLKKKFSSSPEKTSPNSDDSTDVLAQPNHVTPPSLPPSSPSSTPISTPTLTETTPKISWFQKLQQGLSKTAQGITTVFSSHKIDDAFYEELEDALLMADTGVSATTYLISQLKNRVKENKINDPILLKAELIEIIASLLAPLQKPLEIGSHQPTVIMVAGVNGAGKTTSIGKLTHHLARQGEHVLLCCADTFRAAAREQLMVWADRNWVEIISQHEGDPAAVSFDAVSAGKARGKDVVIIDTAGRLPTQVHLMDELKKIKRVVQKAGQAEDGANSPPHEILLVIDGNTGQNAVAQVKAFDAALSLTGLIVTKLDGTAKGGVLAAIARENPIPIYFIGVGEQLDELATFDCHEFAQALLA